MAMAELLKGKTPVSVLQEICSKKKLTPTYDVLANEGPVHEPIFVMRAQAGDFQGTGKGPSKKKAKHNAATRLLAAMHGIKCEGDDAPNEAPSASDDAAPSNGTAEGQPVNSGMFDGDMQGNPIGELQEYTQKNLLRPPQYQFIGEQGPPHAREFVCTVKLSKLQETAVGKSKKIAKRAAASKLLQSVRQAQNDTSSTAILDEEEDEMPLPMITPGIEQESKKIHALTVEAARKAKEFFEKLKQGNKAPGNLRTLQSSLNSGATDFKQVLADLTKEKKFDVRYLEMTMKSYSDQYQCLVQISTPSIAVCYGTGKTMKEAHNSAAHNALQYLKLMAAES